MRALHADRRWASVAAVVSLVGAIICFAIALNGCDPAAAAEAKTAAAEASFTADQLACVDQYETRAAIDKCRDEVRARWGVTTTHRKDGGL